jgi:hypothetical protein
LGQAQAQEEACVFCLLYCNVIRTRVCEIVTNYDRFYRSLLDASTGLSDSQRWALFRLQAATRSDRHRVRACVPGVVRWPVARSSGDSDADTYGERNVRRGRNADSDPPPTICPSSSLYKRWSSGRIPDYRFTTQNPSIVEICLFAA